MRLSRSPTPRCKNAKMCTFKKKRKAGNADQIGKINNKLCI